jgi:hypothetical protein
VDVEQALALFAHFLALAERTSLQTHGVPPTPER